MDKSYTYWAAPPLEWCPVAPYWAQCSQKWMSVTSPQWRTVVRRLASSLDPRPSNTYASPQNWVRIGECIRSIGTKEWKHKTRLPGILQICVYVDCKEFTFTYNESPLKYCIINTPLELQCTNTQPSQTMVLITARVLRLKLARRQH